jgi:hypothetical protein
LEVETLKAGGNAADDPASGDERPQKPIAALSQIFVQDF